MNSLVTISNGQPVTNTITIAKNTDVDHASVIKLVRTYQADLEEFGLLDFKSESSGGRPTEFADLNEQQSTLILTYMRNSDIVRKFKMPLVKEFWELAKRPALVAVPQTLAQALRVAADLAEQKEIAEQQRDEAIATKALIGNRSEATSMATASAAKRETKKLEIQLDIAKEYATVKRMEMIYHGQKFNWRMLKAAATEMDMPPIAVFDANYGTVKAYHASVWKEAFALDIDQQEAEAV